MSLWAAFACNGEALTKAAQVDAIGTPNSQHDSPIVFQDSAFIHSNSPDDPDTVTYVRFPELTLVFNRLVVWEDEQKLSALQTDSVNLYAELGETIEGQQISVLTDVLTDITIEQRYETSVVISNEGPHCDLVEWKHYYSDWKPLTQSPGGTFIGLTYDIKETERFPKLPITELKETVRKQCGEEWYQLVKNIKSPNEYPSSVGISRYVVRVSGKQKGTGKTIRKIIAIGQSMGC